MKKIRYVMILLIALFCATKCEGYATAEKEDDYCLRNDFNVYYETVPAIVADGENVQQEVWEGYSSEYLLHKEMNVCYEIYSAITNNIEFCNSDGTYLGDIVAEPTPVLEK